MSIGRRELPFVVPNIDGGGMMAGGDRSKHGFLHQTFLGGSGVGYRGGTRLCHGGCWIRVWFHIKFILSNDGNVGSHGGIVG